MDRIFWLASKKGAFKAAPLPTVIVPAAGVRDQLVLVVDDYEDTRALYAEHLREAGFRTAEASDGEEAVALAVHLEPDAIVMDLSMPRLDGWDATRRIRTVIALEHTYILALSAMECEISRVMAFDAGCNDFIAKPFLPSALIEVLTIHFRAVTRRPRRPD